MRTKKVVKSKYDLQADKFIEETGLKIIKTFEGYRPYFNDGGESRNVWRITFEIKGKQPYTFTSGIFVMILDMIPTA